MPTIKQKIRAWLLKKLGVVDESAYLYPVKEDKFDLLTISREIVVDELTMVSTKYPKAFLEERIERLYREIFSQLKESGTIVLTKGPGPMSTEIKYTAEIIAAKPR